MMQSELISQDNEEQEQTLQPVDFQAQLKKPSSERPHPPVPTAATAYAALIEKANLDVYPLVEQVTDIGRGRSSQIRLKDRVVSRHHAQIKLLGDRLVLTDLLSKNGTYVNGKRVKGEILLRGGDKVTIGTSEFIVAA